MSPISFKQELQQIPEIVRIAFAYVGIIVGAGLSSGQDIIQYFLSFGRLGLIAVVALGLINIIFGRIILLLGSFYLSSEHTEVLHNIARPLTEHLIDYSLILSNFVIAFVMIAGAGANLQQQFGLAFSWGATLCVLLIFLVAQLNFERITQVLGVFTPILLAMIVILLIASFTHGPSDFEALNQAALKLPRAFSNPVLSIINYYALCAMTGVSMAFVLGGKTLRLGIASKAGALGGALIGLIMFIVSLCLFLNADQIGQSEIPMQSVAMLVHPLFAKLYTLLIFGLLFNTAFSLDYALVQRIAPAAPKQKQNLILGLILAVSLALSHLGFKELVGLMYPILGYLGLILLALLTLAYLRLRKPIQHELKLRRKMLALFAKKIDPKKRLSSRDAKTFNELARASQADTASIKIRVAKRVKNYYQRLK